MAMTESLVNELLVRDIPTPVPDTEFAKPSNNLLKLILATYINFGTKM